MQGGGSALDHDPRATHDPPGNGKPPMSELLLLLAAAAVAAEGLEVSEMSRILELWNSGNREAPARLWRRVREEVAGLGLSDGRVCVCSSKALASKAARSEWKTVGT